MLLIIQRAVAGLEIEKRWSDGVWRGFMESVLGFTLMATRVNILYDRGISAVQCFQAKVGLRLGWCLHRANAVSGIQYGQKILTKLEDNLRMIKMFCHIRKTQTISHDEQKPSVNATQHKSCWICLSTVGKSDPKWVWPHILKTGVNSFFKSGF